MDNLNNSNNNLVVNNESKTYLLETAKWGKFLAIVGFVGIGLMAIGGLFVGTLMSKLSPYSSAAMPTGFISILYILIALLYFMPCYYLYQSSVQLKQALYANDTNKLTEALGNQKSMFKFMGIMMIVVFSLYALMIVGIGISYLVFKN